MRRLGLTKGKVNLWKALDEQAKEPDFAHTFSGYLPTTLGHTLLIFVDEETEAQISCNLSKSHSWKVTEAEVQTQDTSP